MKSACCYLCYIIQVSAGRYNSYGLKSDGTVVSTSDNEYGQANITSWNDIKQVSSGTYQVLGLKNDGTVVCAGGQKSDGACNVSSWTDIKQVVGAGYHSIGLKNDGTVVAVGNNEKGQLDVSTWKDVVAISGGRYHTIGLTKENTFLSLGLNEDENLIITGEEDNDPDENEDEAINEEDNELNSEDVYIDRNNNIVTLELIDQESQITEAIYNPIDFSLKFKGEVGKYILNVRQITHDNKIAYNKIFDIESKNTNGISSGNYTLFNTVISLGDHSNYSFQIAKILGYNDDRDYKISNWIDVDGKYLFRKDFDRLFIDKSVLSVDSNFIAKSNIVGKLDISTKANGSDIDLTKISYTSQAYFVGSVGTDLKQVLSNYNEDRIHTSIPDNFNLVDQFYICNSVVSMTNNINRITKCIPFKLDSIRFGLMKATSTENSDELFTFTQKWMWKQTDFNFRLKIQIPEIEYTNEVIKNITGTNSLSVNIIEEIKQDPNFTLKENSPTKLKVYVAISTMTNGKYLESKPYEYIIDVETSNLSE